MKKVVPIALCCFLFLSLSCSSGGGGGNAPGLFYSQITNATDDEIGYILVDHQGNSILFFYRDNGDLDYVIWTLLKDGEHLYITMGNEDLAPEQKNNYPHIITGSSGSIFFTNYTDTTVDLDIVDINGNTENFPNVSLDDQPSDMGQLTELNLLGVSSVNFVSSSSPNPLGVLWTTLRTGTCPAAVALGAASIVGSVPMAVFGCGWALTDLYMIVAKKPVIFQRIMGIFKDASGDCEAVKNKTNTGNQFPNCRANAIASAQSNDEFITENGEAEKNKKKDKNNDGNDNGEFVGSCDTIEYQDMCINYFGMTVSEAQSACAGIHPTEATFSQNQSCPDNNHYGTCTTTMGVGTTQLVYYTDSSIAQDFCDQVNGTWSNDYNQP